MNLRDLLPLVLSNLKRMKGRVIMTALGVVIGTAAVVVLVSLGAGLQRQATQSLGSGGGLTELRVMGPRTPSGPQAVEMGVDPSARRQSNQPRLDAFTIAEIEALPGVAQVYPTERLQMGGELEFGRLRGYAQVIGVDPAYLQNLTLAKGTLDLRRGQVIAGARVAENFHDPEAMQGGYVMGPGPSPQGEREIPDIYNAILQMTLRRYSQEDGSMAQKSVRFQVAGVLEPVGWRHDYTIYAPLEDVIAYNRWIEGGRRNPNRDGYEELIVQTTSRRETLRAEQEISEMGFMVQSERQQVEQANAFFRTLQAILGGIGAIALLVAAFGIANTMLMAIYERTREIGLMKAIGASNQDVMTVFLAEAGGIGLLGGVGGVTLGMLLNGVLSLIGRSMMQGQPVSGQEQLSITYTPLWLPLFAVAFAALVGVVSGAYPASRAARLSPIKALKYE
ncbi:MAG: ABC transporter permease [Anaerolineae bacterium]